MTALTLYDPLKGLLPRRRLFDDLFRPFFFDTFEEKEYTIVPRVDVAETEHEYLVTAELPGFAEKEIQLELNDRQLKLTAEHEEEKKEEQEEYHLRERRYGTYVRVFNLPENVDREKINAKMENGVLKVTLSKTEESKPKKIEIKVH